MTLMRRRPPTSTAPPSHQHSRCDAGDVLAGTLARSANSFLDQSFLSGLFDMVEALKDPERSASRFGGRLASGLVPMSAAVRTVQQGVDPVVRQPQSIAETVQGLYLIAKGTEEELREFYGVTFKRTAK